jgi:hypothetical protein
MNRHTNKTLADLVGSKPIRLPPGWSGYWKHPPLRQRSPTSVHLPPRWSGYWKHPPSHWKLPPSPDPARVHAIATAALSSWQIHLIADGAVLLAAVIALAVRRARTRRTSIDAG